MLDCVPRNAAFLLLVASIACSSRSERVGENNQRGDDLVADEPPVVSPSGERYPSSRPAVRAGHLTPAPWLKGARRIAVGTLEGKTVIAVGAVRALRLHRLDGSLVRRVPAAGSSQVLRFADVDGDGVPELIGGWGIGVETREAATELKVLDGAKLEHVHEIEVGKTTRHQVVDVAVDRDGDVVVAHFVSKYQVSLSKLDMKGRKLQPMGRVRMLSGLDVVATANDEQALALARIYGDALGEPGGLYLFNDEGKSPIPSVRGARAVRWSRKDQEMVIADGWHREYAAKAQALITRLSPANDGRWTRKVLANVAGRHGFDRLVVGDIDGDGKTDVVAAGNGAAVTVPMAGGEVLELGGGEATDAALADVDGDGQAEVLIVGSEPVIWRRTR